MPTVAIETHGCKLNQADSQAMAREFARAGYRVVPPSQPADVYVLDTCTVTHVADRKARHALRAARRRSPGSIIVVTGCYAQREAATLEALEEVDLVLGASDKGRVVREVVSLLGAGPGLLGGGEGLSAGDEGTTSDENAASRGILRTRAMVKVQEGCNQGCTYCVVPRVRGRERSIPASDIVAQVLALEKEGFQEVVLTGTRVGAYGLGISGASLERLLKSILRTTAIPRIRVSSLQPQEMGEGLLGLWEDSRLCPHFHMPLQSGSDAVLKRMGRRYTADLFARAVEMVRARVAGASITTDVLVGFPGEGEEEFQATYGLCRELRFSGMHVFPYSARPGTPAAHLEDEVDSRARGRRVEMLLALARESAGDFRRGLVGKVRPVLWEGVMMHHGHRLASGLTDSYIRVLAEESGSQANTIADTRLVEERDGNLYGRRVGASPPRGRRSGPLVE